MREFWIIWCRIWFILCRNSWPRDMRRVSVKRLTTCVTPPTHPIHISISINIQYARIMFYGISFVMIKKKKIRNICAEEVILILSDQARNGCTHELWKVIECNNMQKWGDNGCSATFNIPQILHQAQGEVLGWMTWPLPPRPLTQTHINTQIDRHRHRDTHK